MNLLSPYQTNQWYGKTKAVQKPMVIEGHEEFEIDKILDHWNKGKGVEYLITWKGYPLAE